MAKGWPSVGGIEYIRMAYGVPAKRGARVTFTGCACGEPHGGEIRGVQGVYLRVRLDGSDKLSDLHPTWELEYDDDKTEG